MTWDYKVENIPSTKIQQRLSQLGRNGWELVATTGSTYYLKRPGEYTRSVSTFDQAMTTFATELGMQAALHSLGYDGSLTDREF